MEDRFMNPILDGDYADPSILRDGDDYWMTHSCGCYAPGLLVWHSRDMVSWEPVGCALEKQSRDIAAPELVMFGGRYHIYYPEAGTNWVVHAPSPRGPWSAPIDLEVGRLIDPGFIATPEGEKYLHFCDGRAARLAPDGLSLAEAPRKVYDGWRYDESYNVEGFFLESPKLFLRNGWYYLISAQGGTAGPATAHMAVAARSRTPLGPWENSPYNPLVHTRSRAEKWWARGHGTIIEARDGSWWIVYHAYERGYLTLGRKVLMEPIEWTEDGWPRVPAGTDVEGPMRKPAGEGVTPPRLSDDFRGTRLEAQWRFFDGWEPGRVDPTPDGLVMAGRGTEPGDSSPMTCSVGDHAYEASVEVELLGGASAGLILFYDARCYCGIGLTPRGISLYKYGRPYVQIPCPQRRVFLRLHNDHHDVIPSYSLDGRAWTRAGFCFETSGCHHNAFDGYYSLRPGLFACREGKARFRDFIYRGID